MKKFLRLFVVVLSLVCIPMLSVNAEALEIPKAAFCLVDYTGDATPANVKAWSDPVKWAYYYPRYEMVNLSSQMNSDVEQAIYDEKNKISKETLAAIAKKNGVETIGLIVLRDMQSYIVNYSWGVEPGCIAVRSILRADLYSYNADGDKYNRKIIRKNELEDLGLAPNLEDTLKWEFANVINKMEGRPQI